MKRSTRVLTVVGTLLGVVLVLLLVLPLLFQDQIAAKAKEAVNRSVNANVEWRDAGLSFFRHFPHLTLRLDSLTVANRERFQGDTLAAVRHLGVVLDLGSVVGYAIGGKPIVVRGVELDQPRLELIALEDGTANWNITRDSGLATHDSKSMTVSLRNFQIKDGAVAFDNRSTKLNLNDLELGVTGSARTVGKNLAMDLAFKAPNENFRSILSLVPAVYARDFDKIKTAGGFTAEGRIKGEYGDSAFPAFNINAKVENAAFQYPDLPLPVRDVVMNLGLTNPGGSPDSTVVNLDRFHMRLGANPVDARLVVRTPVSDPNVDLRMKGKLDLADVRRAVKLDKVDQLSGTVAADAAVRTRMSAIDKKQYDRVAASGTIDVADLTMKSQPDKSLRLPLHIQQASLQLTPQRANLTRFTGTVGSSDLQATGAIDNLIAYAFRDDTLKGTATVRSNHFDLDEWRTGGGDLQIIPVPPNLDFAFNTTVNELTYNKLKMTGATGSLRVKDRRVTLNDFRMNTLGGEIALNGYYETKDTTKPAFDVGFRMAKIDIPSAFKAFTTVQMLAPVAKYARGTINTQLNLNGSLGKNMLPLFQGLTGKGALQTANIALHDFPAMEKLVDVTKLQILNNPTMQAIRTTFQIDKGRLSVNPFKVNVGPVAMQVSGSNGLDQSLDYKLQLEVPRSVLGGGANQALAGLASQAGRAGIDIAAAPVIPLGVQLGGSVTNPVVKADVGTLTSSVTQGATQAVKAAATAKVDSAAMKLVQEGGRP